MFNNDAIIQIYNINNYIQEITTKACKQLKINHLELLILSLSSNNEMTVSKLSKELGVSKSAISQSVVCLAIKRLITKEYSEYNKKVFFIKPTKKAIDLCSKILEAHINKIEHLKSQIGNSELCGFFKTLDKINKFVNNEEV